MSLALAFNPPEQALEAAASAKEAREPQVWTPPAKRVLPPDALAANERLQLQPTLRLDSIQIPEPRETQRGRGKGKGKDIASPGASTVSSDPEGGSTVTAKELVALAKQSSQAAPAEPLPNEPLCVDLESSQARESMRKLSNIWIYKLLLFL